LQPCRDEFYLAFDPVRSPRFASLVGAGNSAGRGMGKNPILVAQTLTQRYVSSWNDADADARRRLFVGLWTGNRQYADPLMQAGGQDGIAARIGGVPGRFPGCRSPLAGTADGHGPYLRFAGVLDWRMTQLLPAAPTLRWRRPMDGWLRRPAFWIRCRARPNRMCPFPSFLGSREPFRPKIEFY
jgi:hypothetical protein